MNQLTADGSRLTAGSGRGLRPAFCILLSAFCILLSAGPALATEGGLSGAFLDYGPAPRSLAMGKAFTAIADDVQAGYFNPAGLFQLNAQEVVLAHSQLYGGMRMEYLGYGIPTKELGTFSVTILNLGAENVDSRTPNNNRYDGYWFSENAYTVSYAYNPVHFLGFGANLKVIAKNIAQYSGATFGADLGTLVRGPGPLSFGLVWQNAIQPKMTLATIEEIYPQNLRAGAAVSLLSDRVKASFDLACSDFLTNGRRSFTPRGGVEFAIVPRILVSRAGFDPNEISLGLGLQRYWGKMGLGVDYAFLLHHQSGYRLPPTHKLGVFTSFAGFRVWVEAQPENFSPTPDEPENVLWMDVRLMTRSPAKRWQLLVKNAYGEVVRSYSGWDAPPLRLTWDGLDDAGRLVSDGRYSYEIIVVDQRNSTLKFGGTLTELRTRGPRGRIQVRPGR